jgi:lipopolysaccharide biosynthesis protein
MLTAPQIESLFDYDIFGHFHGKRSLHVDSSMGDSWRNFLWEHLVGGEYEMVDCIVDAFETDPTLGLVFAEDPNLNDWDQNRALAEGLASRMGLATVLPTHFDFPLGTMFWARPQALKPLFDLGLTPEDFPGEPLPIDGTLLHALERLIPFAAIHRGYRYATTYLEGWTR